MRPNPRPIYETSQASLRRVTAAIFRLRGNTDRGWPSGAGVSGATMYDAIDLLMARFRYRLHRLEDTRPDQPIGSFPANAA
jgi:hypothetical protein